MQTKISLDYKYINELRQQGKPLKEIMKILGIPNDTKRDYERFKKQLQRKAPKYLIKAGTFKGHTPYASSVMVDANGDVKLAWIKSSAKEQMLSALLESIKDIPELYIPKLKTEIYKNLLEISLFDMHFGINTFEDYRGHLDEIAMRQRQGYDHTLITVGSDLLHHNDMRSNTAGGTPIEQVNVRNGWNDALKFYMSLIAEAVKHSNNVTVIYVKGNHDESLSWTFVQLLKQLFPTVIFEDSFKERKLFTWEKIFIGLIHGDKPINNIDKVFIRENKQAYANADIVEIHVGHTHKEVAKGNVQDLTGTMVRVLSTSAKTDQWHDDKNFVGANKRFQLFEYAPHKLNGSYYVDGRI